MNVYEVGQVVSSISTSSNYIVKNSLINKQNEIYVSTMTDSICFSIDTKRVVAALDKEGRIQIIHPITKRLMKGKQIKESKIIDVEVIAPSVKHLPAKVPIAHILSPSPIKKGG